MPKNDFIPRIDFQSFAASPADSKPTETNRATFPTRCRTYVEHDEFLAAKGVEVSHSENMEWLGGVPGMSLLLL